MAWRWPRLMRWFRRRAVAVPDVTLYTRHGCHLCDEAHTFLAGEQRRAGFRLDVVDVDADSALLHRFGQDVPVIAVAGRVRFRGRVHPVLWRRVMRRAGR